MVISLTKNNVKQEVEQATKPVIVDVYASWCGPCMHMKPIFEDIAKEYSAAYTFAELNVDESRELAIAYGVTSVPTFIFINKNEIKGKVTGTMSKEDFVEKMQELLA